MTAQLGAVLFLGLVVVLLAGYQATVIPDANAGVEFDHDRAVRTDLQQLRDGVVRTAEAGGEATVPVAVGTDYPDRIVAVNPAPVTGRLVVEPFGAPITVSNATAVDNETRDYWSGGNHTYRTASVRYRVDYNEYRDAPEARVYENTVLYEDVGGRNRSLSGQLLVDGRQLTLVTLRGDYATTAGDVERVPVRSVSPGDVDVESVAVRNTTGNVTLRVPTRLSASRWRSLLAGEPRVASVDPAGGGRVAIALEPGVYELRVARVRVGTHAAPSSARYATAVGGNRTVETGEVTELAVEVRDRYDNPVEGIRVNATLVDADGRRIDAEVTTGEDGRASLRYEAGTTTGTDVVRIGFDNATLSLANRSVVFGINVVDAGRDAAASVAPRPSSVGRPHSLPVADVPVSPGGVDGRASRAARPVRS